jgi:preprotein translocase subunit SecD
MINFPKWKSLLTISGALVFAWFAAPNFLNDAQKQAAVKALPNTQLNLGLDLQGGSHLLLEVDAEHYLKEQAQNLAEDIRAKLRETKLPYSRIAVSGKRVKFSSTGEAEAVQAAITALDNNLQITTKNEGSYTVRYTERAEAEMRQKLIEQSIEIVNRRVNETGTREPIIQRQGEGRVLVQVPGLENPARLKELLGRTAKMTFHLLDNSVSMEDASRGMMPPPGTRFLPSDDPTETDGMGKPFKYPVKGRVMLSGDLLTGASATYEQGRPVVAFKFNTLGARKFAKITQDNVGKPFAIVLDNKVITAPRINEPILSGSGIISGNFSVESANDLALLLRAGALPAPLKVVEERTVGPSLGADSIAAGTKACLLGVALIMVFMVLGYGLFGLLANLSLLVNLTMLLGALSLFHATLTLPGIAGIVLTMGMAVDANILIYERIREEMRHGKSALAALQQGFQGAFGTILDSNLTTLIAAVLLYYFGTGSVKGFAVALSLGILTSMFTAIYFTKMLVAGWMNWKRPKLLPL